IPIGIEVLDVDSYLDELGATWPLRTFLAFRVGIVLIALAPLVLLFRLHTFAGVDLDSRLRVLDRLYVSNIYFVRQLIAMLKMTAGFLYGASPQIRQAIAPGGKTSGVALAQLRRKEAVPS